MFRDPRLRNTALVLLPSVLADERVTVAPPIPHPLPRAPRLPFLFPPSSTPAPAAPGVKWAEGRGLRVEGLS